MQAKDCGKGFGAHGIGILGTANDTESFKENARKFCKHI